MPGKVIQFGKLSTCKMYKAVITQTNLRVEICHPKSTIVNFCWVKCSLSGHVCDNYVQVQERSLCGACAEDTALLVSYIKPAREITMMSNLLTEMPRPI